jgi:outer membrane protein TolC
VPFEVDSGAEGRKSPGEASNRGLTPAGSGEAGEIRPAEAPPPYAVFSLEEAIAFGLQNNPRLRASAVAIGRAQGLAQIAFSPLLPQVDLLTRYIVTSENLGPGSPGPVGAVLPDKNATHSFAQAELEVLWTIYDFGRTGGRYGQAVSRERIAELQLARAKETVAFDVTTDYMQGLLTAAVRVVQEEAIRSAEATLKDTRARRAAGVADRDDVLRADVQLSESRDALVVAQEAELAALARLNNALGRNAGLPLELVDRKATPEFALSLVKCLETAAAQRQEVRIAQEAVAGAMQGRRAAAAGFLPAISVRGSVGYVDGQNVLAGWQEGAGIHINTPIYHGGAQRGELHAAEAEVLEAAANAQSILDNITLEVTLAYRSVVAARQRIGLSEPAVAQARENLRLVRDKYRNGNATPTDIVDAETALTRARQRFYSATYQYLAALARLDYAMGSPQGSLLPAAARPGDCNAPTPELLPPPRPAPAEE